MGDNINILLLSDTHIGFDHPPNNKSSKIRRRGFDFFKNFKSIIDKALELSVKYVIHCGDVFEKSTVPAFLVDQTYGEFLRLANAGIKVLIIPGNHEKSVLPSSLFLNHTNIHVFDVARTFHFEGISFSGFPYFKGDIRNKFADIRTQLEKDLNEEHFNILCVHHAIDGVKAGYQFFEFRNRKDTLNQKDLPGKFDLILSGHIHKYQTLQAQGNNGRLIPIIYSGSTERTMFDEKDEIKGYHTLRIQHKTFKHQFHPIKTRNMHQIDLRTEIIQPKEVASYLAIKLASIAPDAIVQISSNQEDILYELSTLKTKGYFPETMNVTLSGFSILHKKSKN